MSNQSRVSAGNSDGGQFAPKQHPEAHEVDLTGTQPTVAYMHPRFEIRSYGGGRRGGDIEVVVPAGDYVLGDPCYVIPDEQWAPLLETNDCFGAGDDPETQSPVGYIEHTPEPLTRPNGDPVPGQVPTTLRVEVLAFGTAYGDGCYQGSDGYEYPVDAGLIGLVPVAAADPAEVAKATSVPRNLSRHITFTGPTKCTRAEDGTLTFGSVVIKTGDEDEEDDGYCANCGVRPAEGFSDECYECQVEYCTCGMELDGSGSCEECDAEDGEDIAEDED